MARKTSLKESTRRKGQLRIDQQAALRRQRKRRLADPNSVLREGEATPKSELAKARSDFKAGLISKAAFDRVARGQRLPKKKKKIDPSSVVREGEVNTVGGVARLLRRKRKQREAIFE
jgi:hypothetical protein